MIKILKSPTPDRYVIAVTDFPPIYFSGNDLLSLKEQIDTILDSLEENYR
jgi:hypothetical protein